MTKSGANQQQYGGDHYKNKAIEPWDYITQNNIPYLEGNIIRYATRWREKGGMQDLFKLRHYIEKLIEIEMAKPQPERGGATVERFPSAVTGVHAGDKAVGLDKNDMADRRVPRYDHNNPPAVELEVTELKRKKLHAKVDELDEETINFLHDGFVRW